MTDSSPSALIHVAFEVCTALERVGTTAVLTGGSAATFYAPDACQSFDIDFVITMRSESGGGRQALLDIGYTLKGDYYVHDQWPFPLEFPPGPLMIGSDQVKTSRARTSTGCGARSAPTTFKSELVL